MGDILDRIDAVTDGRCPCGAEPVPGSAYCGPDCEPTHLSEDTDDRESGWLATPMRWRPDLVTAADDTDLIPLGSETHGYTGRFNAQVYERASDPTTWHLRLDDGNRFVGLDLTNVGGRQDPITEELVGQVREAWQRLERELVNPDHAVPGYDQWVNWTDVGYVDEAEGPWADVMSALLSRGQAVIYCRPSGDDLSNELATYDPSVIGRRRSYHNEVVRAVDVSASDLVAVGRMVRESMQPLTAAAEAFLRDLGVQLTDWQRQMLEGMYRVQAIQPRRFGLSAAVQARAARSGFRPLVNARQAAVLAEHGLREGLDFLRDAPAPEPAQGTRNASVPERDEPPADPMARALWLRQRRNTGPGPDRLDGRRRRRR